MPVCPSQVRDCQLHFDFRECTYLSIFPKFLWISSDTKDLISTRQYQWCTVTWEYGVLTSNTSSVFPEHYPCQSTAPSAHTVPGSHPAQVGLGGWCTAPGTRGLSPATTTETVSVTSDHLSELFIHLMSFKTVHQLPENMTRTDTD